MLICSDFIKDLLDLPSTQSIEEAPIHVHQPANVVRKFIDCVISSQDHDFKLGFTEIKDFVDLCDHLQAPTVKLGVMRSLKLQMGNSNLSQTFDAWGIFKLAANQADVALAKLAIGHFDRSGIILRDLFLKRPSSYFDDIPPRYVYALLRCFIHPIINTFTYEGITHNAMVFRSGTQAASAFTLD